jgi:ElaA protein
MNWKSTPFDQLTTRQLYEILSLRQEVFVVEQQCPYLDNDRKDFDCHHLMRFDDGGRLVAYARLLPKGLAYPEAASIGRVVTSPSVRRTGVGRDLMREAIRQLERTFNESKIKIGAQSYLMPFYQSFGFEPVGEEYMEDGIPHIHMIRS